MPKRESLKSSALGTLNQNTAVTVKCAITADASSGLEFAVPFAMDIYEVVAICTTANASGTATVSDGTNDISDAVAMAVLDAVDRAATIDSTYSSVSGSITVTTNGANDRGVVYVTGYRV